MSAAFRLPAPYAEHAALSATTDHQAMTRIDGVIPWVVRLVNQFRDSLQPSEQHAFPVDDLLQECWVELLEKDAVYDPTRSPKYITFAGLVVRQKLSELRNRWHLVRGPRNTAARLRNETEEPADAIEAIRRTIRTTATLDEGLESEHGHEAEALQEAKARNDRLAEALTLISPQQARVLRWSYGLFATEARPTAEIAATLGVTNARMIQIRHDAERALATILDSL